MSKSRLKKHLSSLSVDQLVEVVMGLYDARKEAKEYLEFYLDPDSEAMMEKARVKIRGYFTSRTGRPLRRPKFAKCAKVIADYLSLSPDQHCAAELMLDYLERCVAFLGQQRRGREQFYSGVKTAYSRLVKYLAAQGLIAEYSPRLGSLIASVDRRGGTLADTLLDIHDPAG